MAHAIAGAPPAPRHFRRHQHIVRANETCDLLYRIEDGWACRYARFGGGRRQITALYLPGEYCEPHWLFDHRSHAPVVALTHLRMTPVSIQSITSCRSCAGEVRNVMGDLLKVLQRQSDWIAALGRKTAPERVCTVLLDIYDRLRAMGRVSESACPMPLTQVDLADIVGLTPVHVNRVLRDLRESGVLELRGKRMRLLNANFVQAIAATNDD